MRFYERMKSISLLLVFTGLLLLSACAQGTGIQPTLGPARTPPSSPADCAGEATSSMEITVTWSIPDELTGHLGFRVYQGVDSLEEEIADPAADSFVAGNLAAGTQYHFDVRAFDASGESTADACAVDVTTLQ